ncbi:hypothetical protein BC830DRAFT_1162824 [Chytriomyces sp. MP71]|nr:hypothetical protein BC830DRAFT_1162824 [Chytriomyces sp. MP71]
MEGVLFSSDSQDYDSTSDDESVNDKIIHYKRRLAGSFVQSSVQSSRSSMMESDGHPVCNRVATGGHGTSTVGKLTVETTLKNGASHEASGSATPMVVLKSAGADQATFRAECMDLTVVASGLPPPLNSAETLGATEATRLGSPSAGDRTSQALVADIPVLGKIRIRIKKSEKPSQSLPTMGGVFRRRTSSPAYTTAGADKRANVRMNSSLEGDTQQRSGVGFSLSKLFARRMQHTIAATTTIPAHATTPVSSEAIAPSLHPLSHLDRNAQPQRSRSSRTPAESPLNSAAAQPISPAVPNSPLPPFLSATSQSKRSQPPTPILRRRQLGVSLSMIDGGDLDRSDSISIKSSTSSSWMRRGLRRSASGLSLASLWQRGVKDHHGVPHDEQAELMQCWAANHEALLNQLKPLDEATLSAFACGTGDGAPWSPASATSHAWSRSAPETQHHNQVESLPSPSSLAPAAEKNVRRTRSLVNLPSSSSHLSPFIDTRTAPPVPIVPNRWLRHAPSPLSPLSATTTNSTLKSGSNNSMTLCRPPILNYSSPGSPLTGTVGGADHATSPQLSSLVAPSIESTGSFTSVNARSDTRRRRSLADFGLRRGAGLREEVEVLGGGFGAFQPPATPPSHKRFQLSRLYPGLI